MMGFERRGSLRFFALCLGLLAACGDDDGMVTDAGRDGMVATDGGMCSGVTQCAAVGTTCAGNQLVTCALDATGCRVETRTNCASTDQVCDASGATAMCVTPDVCAGLENACETEGRTCDADTLVICAPNEDGCLVATETDCAMMPDGACDDGGEMPMCVLPADPCMGLVDACETAGTSCDGTSLVTCAPNAFGCLVETATDCSARASGTCAVDEVAACTFTGDPCAEVEECTPGAPSCDGASLVTCAADAFGCFVETRTDCTDAPFGFCDVDGDPAATCSTAAVDPCMGVTQCDPVGRACDENDLNVCAVNAFGCAVETTTECATDGDVCDATSGMAACVDPCTLVDTCPAETYCAEGAVVTCAADANGCLVETGRADCDAGEICEAVAGPAMCVTDVCPAAPAVTLDCTSGTISGNTADGSATIDAYPGCSTFTDYESNEQLHRFRSASRQRVRIVATRAAASGDYDLYVLQAPEDGVCAPGMTCLDGSTTTSATETIDFVAEPSQLYYVAYDLFSTSPGATTEYTLAITCEAIVCGDGVVGDGEACDDGDTDDGDGCSAACAIEDGSACTGEPSDCNVIACGDGLVQGTETCDDGDMDDGDGCSMACAIEDGYLCTGAPSLCEVACGNGVVNTSVGETCDDGDTDGMDGCSATCTVEDGYLCTGAPSLCALACGNGVVNTSVGETCDDGDTDGMDGCSATCTVEDGYRCSGAPSVCGTLAPNGTCATAIAITEATTIEDAALLYGGPQPTATGCGGGTSNRTLYYEVTVPGQTRVTAQTTTNGNDLLLFVLDACGDAACSFATDSAPERGVLTNGGTTPITRIVGVRSYSSATPTPIDLSFSYESYVPAPNATCATATEITETTTLTTQQLATGGARPSGTGCGSGTGDVALYYEVTIPDGQRVQVQTAPGSDIVLFTQNACGDTGCTSQTDSSPEQTLLENTSGATVTRVVGVRNYTAGTASPFGISFTYSAIVATTNVTCEAATEVTADVAFAGQTLSLGTARPMGTNCLAGSGNNTLWYSVTVPAGEQVTVQTAPGSDIVLFTQAACGDTACLQATDASPERLALANGGASPLTRVVGVRNYTAGTAAPFGISFTYGPLTNAVCEGGTAVTETTSFTGVSLVGGGAQPTDTDCTRDVATMGRYYTVTIPAGTEVTVVADPTDSSWDPMIDVKSACGASTCVANQDGGGDGTTETLVLTNATAAPITRIVSIGTYYAGENGTYDATFTYLAL